MIYDHDGDLTRYVRGQSLVKMDHLVEELDADAKVNNE